MKYAKNNNTNPFFFYVERHISKHLLFPLSRVKLKVLFTSFMTISFLDVFETETLIDFSIKLYGTEI